MKKGLKKALLSLLAGALIPGCSAFSRLQELPDKGSFNAALAYAGDGKSLSSIDIRGKTEDQETAIYMGAETTNSTQTQTVSGTQNLGDGYTYNFFGTNTNTTKSSYFKPSAKYKSDDLEFLVLGSVMELNEKSYRSSVEQISGPGLPPIIINTDETEFLNKNGYTVGGRISFNFNDFFKAGLLVNAETLNLHSDFIRDEDGVITQTIKDLRIDSVSYGADFQYQPPLHANDLKANLRLMVPTGSDATRWFEDGRLELYLSAVGKNFSNNAAVGADLVYKGDKVSGNIHALMNLFGLEKEDYEKLVDLQRSNLDYQTFYGEKLPLQRLQDFTAFTSDGISYSELGYGLRGIEGMLTYTYGLPRNNQYLNVAVLVNRDGIAAHLGYIIKRGDNLFFFGPTYDSITSKKPWGSLIKLEHEISR